MTAKKYFQQRILDENQTFGADIEYLFAAQAITETKQIMDSMGIALRKSFVGSVDATPITVNTVKNPEMINRFLLKDAGYRFLLPVRGTPLTDKKYNLSC